MEKRKECWLKLAAGLGWAGFGAVALATSALPFWIGWGALAIGGGVAACALDLAMEPKRW